MSTDILDTPQAGPTAVRGATVRVVGYLTSVVLSVISAALVLRYLGAERFGQYTTIFSLLAIVMGLADAGTMNIGVREHAVRPPEGRGRMLASLQGLRLTLTTAGVLLAVGFAALAPYTDAMLLGTALGGLGLLLTVFALTLSIPLHAELQLVRVTLLEVVRQVATVVVLVSLVAAGAGVALLLGAPIAAGIVLVAATILLVRGRASAAALAFDARAWRALLADTLAYTAATAIGVIYSYVTILMMSVVTTEAQTGYFGAAHRVWLVLTAIPALLVGSAFPLLARSASTDRERLAYGIQRILETQLVVGAGLALVVAAGAPVAIDVVAGPEYGPAVPVLRLLAVAFFATALIALGAYALLALRLHRALLVGNLLALVTTAALAGVLGERDGATGAALAVVAGELVVVVVYAAALVRAGVRPSPRAVPRVAAATLLAAIPAFALGLPALPAALAGGIVFAVAVLALRAVPQEALDAFRELRPGAGPPRTPPPPGSS